MSATNKRELEDSGGSEDGPEWQGFPFMPRVESEEEEEVVLPKKKKKSQNKNKSQKATSVIDKNDLVPSTIELGGVLGGMFGALVKAPSKSKKQKQDQKEAPPSTHKASDKSSTKTPAKGLSSSVQSTTSKEIVIGKEYTTIWNGTSNKIKKGHGCIMSDSIGSSTSESTNEWLAIALSSGEQLCCVGSARITCVRGRVEILGLILDGQDSDSKGEMGGNSAIVHSPSWYGATIIKAVGRSVSSSNMKIESSLSSFIDKSNEFPIHLLIESLPKSIPTLYTAASDGNYGNIQQSCSSLSWSGLDKSASSEDEITCLDTCLAGWCIVHKDSSFAATTAVINISKPWVEAADRVVAEHVMKLNQCLDEVEEKGEVNESVKVSFPSQRIMVCGSKGVGKSTFVRYVTHRLISARRDWLRLRLDVSNRSKSFKGGKSSDLWDKSGLHYLDFDVGQPEFTPPGSISLHCLEGSLLSHSSFPTQKTKEEEEEKEEDYPPASTLLLGPPNTHMKTSFGAAAVFFGDTTPRRDPQRYILGANKLIKGHQSRVQSNLSNTIKHIKHDTAYLLLSSVLIQSTPLVVNCDGWTNGLGEHVLSKLMQLVNPHHMIQILGNGSKYFYILGREELMKSMLQVDPIDYTATADTTEEVEFVDANFDNKTVKNTQSTSPFEYWVPLTTKSVGEDSFSKQTRDLYDDTTSKHALSKRVKTGLEWMEGAQFTQNRSKSSNSGFSSSNVCGGVLHMIGAWDLEGQLPPDPKLKYLLSKDNNESNKLNEVVLPSLSSQRTVTVSPADLRAIRIATYFSLQLLKVEKMRKKSLQNVCQKEMSKKFAPSLSKKNDGDIDGGGSGDDNIEGSDGDDEGIAHRVRLTASVRNGALADPHCSLALALAACPPYRIPLSQLNIYEIDDKHIAYSPSNEAELFRCIHSRQPQSAYPCDEEALAKEQLKEASNLPLSQQVSNIDLSEMFHSMNGCIVALLATTTHYSTTCENNCIGYGIVRSIDLAQGFLYLLTPIDPALLTLSNKVHTLLKCPPAGDRSLNLPIQLLFGGSQHASTPYLFSEAISSASATMMKSRNNIQRGGGGGGK